MDMLFFDVGTRNEKNVFILNQNVIKVKYQWAESEEVDGGYKKEYKHLAFVNTNILRNTMNKRGELKLLNLQYKCLQYFEPNELEVARKSVILQIGNLILIQIQKLFGTLLEHI